MQAVMTLLHGKNDVTLPFSAFLNLTKKKNNYVQLW